MTPEASRATPLRVGSPEVYIRRCLGLLAVAMIASACGSSSAHRKPRGRDDGGIDAGPEASVPLGPLQYIGSTGPAGGTVMSGGGYFLFSVTGEVPGTSGLSKSPDHRMVGGVLGRAH